MSRHNNWSLHGAIVLSARTLQPHRGEECNISYVHLVSDYTGSVESAGEALCTCVALTVRQWSSSWPVQSFDALSFVYVCLDLLDV
jgi:hypothetical protein